MSKILYPIFNLPNEHDAENESIPSWIKWWLLNNYNKKHSWILSEIITGNPLTLENSVETKFYLSPLPRGNSEQEGEPSPTNEVPITNVTGDATVLEQNKNRFKVTEFDGITQNDDGTFKTTKYYVDTTEVTFKGNPNSQYTISFREDDTLNSTGFSLSVNGTWVNTSSGKYTFTTDSNGETKLKLGAGSYALIGTSNRYIQIEQGTTATTYTPHKEQTYTFPLGTQRLMLGDYLADDGIHHVRKQVTFDGSEDDWRLFFSTQGVFITSNVPNAINNLGTINGLSNRFECTTRNNMRYNLATINNCFSVSANELIIANKSITSVADFKTWLSTHNVTVEYKLATEEITPYTTEQQQAYDEIKQALSYEEQTNISGTSSEAEPIFEVQYYMKNESEGE